MTSDEKAMLPSHSAGPSSRKVKRRRVIIIGSIMGFIAIALAVGLGVGLTVGRPTHRPSPPSSTPTTTPNGGSQGPSSKFAVGMSWDYNIYGSVDPSKTNNVLVHDIDLWDNSAETISDLKAQKVDGQDARVICYFSAGTFEDWRPDSSSFPDSDKGSELPDWPGERWLKTNSPDVRNIMEQRLDMAVQKGCDAVDPDNVDGFDNDNGLGLSEEDAVDFVTFLANAARSRNLAVGLKNAASLIPSVIDVVQFSVNEECHEFDECSLFQPFIEQQKPVFHVEYPKGAEVNNNNNLDTSDLDKICDDSTSSRFSTIAKNMHLDGWIQECPPS